MLYRCLHRAGVFRLALDLGRTRGHAGRWCWCVGKLAAKVFLMQVLGSRRAHILRSWACPHRHSQARTPDLCPLSCLSAFTWMPSAARTVIHLLNGRDRLALVAYSNTAGCTAIRSAERRETAETA